MAKNDSHTPETTTTMRHVMHEIRTPLTQILGCAELLQEEMRDRSLEELVPDAEEIHSAALKLQNIVEALFRGDTLDAPSQPILPPTADVIDASVPATGALLVVDDEPKFRELMVRRLGDSGYTVSTAANGTEALQKIGAETFDTVLLDLMMPDISGLETLHALRRIHPPTELPVIIVSALGDTENTVAALNSGANDFVGKPVNFSILNARISTQISLRNAALELADLSRKLEIRNAFIRRTLGRYVSDEVADSLLDDPTGIELRGERRVVTILKTDLRGFSTLTEACDASQVVAVLNRYLGTMAEIVTRYGGIVDEFQGDALIALFGAPLARENDAESAIRAAIDMQLAIPEVNARNQESGLPLVEMGIGIATGEAVVGNIGTETRAKYGVVGRPINLASRVESYTLGGDILIDQATKDAVGQVIILDRGVTVHPKGFSEPIVIYRVIGTPDSVLPDIVDRPSELNAPIAVRYALVTGSQVGDRRQGGNMHALSNSSARLVTDSELSNLSNLRIEFVDETGEPLPGEFYAKVIAADEGLIRFTTRSDSLESVISRIRG